MPLEDAEGGITLAEEHLAITLADCARFRTLALQAPNRAAALARIYYDDLPEPPNDQDAYTADQLIGLRPFAIITTATQGGFSKARVATETYVEAGKLAILIEVNVESNLADDVSALERRFKNTLGAIVNELLALAYTAPDDDSQYLAIDLISLRGPMRCGENAVPDMGDHLLAMLEVQYGVGVR